MNWQVWMFMRLYVHVLIPHVHAFFRLLLVNSLITIFNFFWHIFSYWTNFVGLWSTATIPCFIAIFWTLYFFTWWVEIICKACFWYRVTTTIFCMDHRCDFCGRISKNVINIMFKWRHHYISMWLRWYFCFGIFEMICLASREIILLLSQFSVQFLFALYLAFLTCFLTHLVFLAYWQEVLPYGFDFYFWIWTATVF